MSFIKNKLVSTIRYKRKTIDNRFMYELCLHRKKVESQESQEKSKAKKFQMFIGNTNK